MALVLEIEHLLGVAFAAQSQASTVPDWPPQPDRVFSALVAAWGARGEKPEERRALEWLEKQPAPNVAASRGFARTSAKAFVPPNDNRVPEKALSSKWFEFLKRGERPPKEGGHRKAWRGALGVMPLERSKAERRFPAFRPDNPIVQFVWQNIEADDGTIAALNALAADTAYVGHSASLTRCRFRSDRVAAPAAQPRRRIYPGRLAELERFYRAGHRPNPGEPVRVAAVAETEPPRSVFADEWLIFEHIGGEMPDLRATALVSKALRCTLMSGYRQSGHEAAIPAAVSGHSADGSPAEQPHLSIAPLAFLGSQFADGRVLGFALIPPEKGQLLSDEDFQSAVRQVSNWNAEQGWRELRLTLHGLNLTFTPSGESNRRSLDPASYVSVAKTWATCTPIVLDRHLKMSGNAERQAEIEGLVRQACLNIGLPEPARVVAGKHSALSGAPSAYPSGRAPHWTRWRLPKSLDSRQLTHAVLQFAEPVRGPVILGAGRFVGLGLCRELAAESR